MSVALGGLTANMGRFTRGGTEQAGCYLSSAAQTTLDMDEEATGLLHDHPGLRRGRLRAPARAANRRTGKRDPGGVRNPQAEGNYR